jgi:predicted nuclease with TOPRIM domain
MEEERSKCQITLAREDNDRQRRENVNVTKSIETVKDKCYKTQSYIRNLLREEAALNENLTKIEDENNYLDGHITELNSVQEMTASECSSTEK